uniref:C-type lectin domain-containing protein n=1 Tax=Panagrolaimus davidi TaxID=227884 RepID=A0A914P5E8_9BILA
MATFIQNCQAFYSKSYPVSICSEGENDFFITIMENTITTIGLYLPTAAAKPSRIYEWADGRTDCQYRNWLSAEPDSFYDDTETVAQIVTYGKWRDVNLTLVSTTLFCKSNALTLQEYADSCQTLDNCAQIN